MDDCGFDMLGAEIHAEGAKDVGRVLKAGGKLIGGILGGSVLGGIVGSVLWASHRVIGGFLGAFVVGPAVGGGIGFALAARDVKAIADQKPIAAPAQNDIQKALANAQSAQSAAASMLPRVQ